MNQVKTIIAQCTVIISNLENEIRKDKYERINKKCSDKTLFTLRREIVLMRKTLLLEGSASSSKYWPSYGRFLMDQDIGDPLTSELLELSQKYKKLNARSNKG